MVRGVAVVTDSSAALPADVREKYDVGVVPLQVVLGGRVYAEGVDVTAADVAAALAARAAINTSRPSPGAFADAYAVAAAAGARSVLSVHLSGGLSGTVDAARLAAADAPVPVEVVDSRSTAMGLGFPVLAAAEAAAADADLATVRAAAEGAISRTRTLFCVGTLDALRRGGRIGQAAAVVGAALMVKPLLEVVDGRIAVLEKVRTTGKAVARLEDVVVAHAGDAGVDIAVHHLGEPERAQALADRLRSRLPGLQSAYLCELGAALVAHVGLGTLGVVVHRR
jgi:DegV family protein with EDD domain